MHVIKYETGNLIFYISLYIARRFYRMIAVMRVTFDGEPTQEVTPPVYAVQNSLPGR